MKKYRDRLEEDVKNWYENSNLNEATDTGGSRGSYNGPLQPGVKIFKKIDMEPFTVPVSKYNDAMLEYDSYDGSMDVPKKQIKNIENKAKKISKYLEKHPELTNSDEDGNNLNQTPGKNETIVPIVREWVEITEDTIVEDLGVWFGTKKKPKGSKQPKGPWVNICRKKEGGGHPPCGRPTATEKGYPKCRAAGVAAKMTDSQKKSACQQKRKAEKTHSKSGTGKSPKMTHYVPKKKQNESFNSLLKKVISEVLKK